MGQAMTTARAFTWGGDGGPIPILPPTGDPIGPAFVVDGDVVGKIPGVNTWTEGPGNGPSPGSNLSGSRSEGWLAGYLDPIRTGSPGSMFPEISGKNADSVNVGGNPVLLPTGVGAAAPSPAATVTMTMGPIEIAVILAAVFIAFKVL